MSGLHYAAAKLHCERGRPQQAAQAIALDLISQGRRPDPIIIQKILEHWGYSTPSQS